MYIEYIEGPKNVVADCFSRLCNKEPPPNANSLATYPDEEIAVLNALIAQTDREATISSAHNDIRGHGGVRRTLTNLKLMGTTWPNMRNDIVKYIKACVTCQKMDQSINQNEASHFTVNTYSPMENISMDFIQGLSPDEDGHDCILVFIDTFTRFVELYPLQGYTANNAAISLLDHSGRYGFPRYLTHDGSKAFLAETIDGLTAWSGIETRLTRPYSHQENSIVERANKEVMRHLRNIIFDRRVLPKWSRYLPLVQRIMNSSIHSTTGFSPAKLLFNNNVDLDRGFIPNTTKESSQDVTYDQWVDELVKASQAILEVARENLRIHDEVHLATSPISPTEFPIGSFVLVNYRGSELRRGPPSKLLPFLKGPLRVVSKDGPSYILHDLVTEKPVQYHVKDIFPFTFDPTTVDPRSIAVRDMDLYTVNKITDMRGNPKKGKAGLQFLVHWVGYDDPTWEPWTSVRRLSSLHNFLRHHPNKNVRNILPKNFIDPNDQ